MDDRPPSTSVPPAPPRRETVPAGEKALRLVAAVLLAAGGTWLVYHFHRLVLDTGPTRAIDLRLRIREVVAWFDGVPVYETMSDAVYPPASYVMLWPVLGLLDMGTARVAWAVLHLGVLVLLARAALRIGEGRSPGEKALLVALPLALYATGATIGNGQLGLVVVLATLSALELAEAKERILGRDVLVAALLSLAVVKPSLGAPFVLLVALRPGGPRIAALTGAAYGALTWVASWFQGRGPVELLLDWRHRAEVGSWYGATRGAGAIREDAEGLLRVTHVNVHSLLAWLGRPDLVFVATLAVLVLLALWIVLRRRAPIWTLAGVCALVTRVSTYHGWYDDVLLLLPLLALWRIGAGLEEVPGRRTARTLFFVLLPFAAAPGGTYALPRPFSDAYVVLQAIVCLAVLLFLGRAAAGARITGPARRGDGAPAPPPAPRAG